MKFKTDKYKSSRGGHTRLLDISCRKCGKHKLFYQKDGPGNLRRMYMDRIIAPERLNKNQYKKIKSVSSLKCVDCGEILAHPYIYKKEKRNAYRLFVDSVKKKMINIKDFSSKK
jgi:ribosomal protein S27E